MLDIGWSELLVIAIVLIVVVGPKDLPPMIRAFGRTMANLRKYTGEFRTQFDQALKEAEMGDVRKTISDVQNLNPTNALRDAINPLRDIGNDIRNDLEKTAKGITSPTSESSGPATIVSVPEPQMKLPDTPPVFDPELHYPKPAAEKPLAVSEVTQAKADISVSAEKTAAKKTKETKAKSTADAGTNKSVDAPAKTKAKSVAKKKTSSAVSTEKTAKKDKA